MLLMVGFFGEGRLCKLIVYDWLGFPGPVTVSTIRPRHTKSCSVTTILVIHYYVYSVCSVWIEVGSN